MSSPLSAALQSSGSEEPAVKRQKTARDEEIKQDDFLYRTDIVLLKVMGRAVAHLPAIKLQNNCSSRLLKGSSESRTLTENGNVEEVRIRAIDFNADEAVIKYLAHWMQDLDAKAAIDASLPCSRTWYSFYKELYGFYTSQYGLGCGFHDALVDFFIEKLRAEMTDPAGPPSDLWDAYDIYRKVHYGEDWTYGGRMDELFAVLCLYYSDDYNNHWAPYCNFHLVGVTSGLLISLREAWRTRSWAMVPKNPLAADFEDYCLYHRHADAYPCYRINKRK